MAKLITKTGAHMKERTKAKLLDVLTNPENDGKTQAEIAKMVNLSERTVRNYLTPELWEMVRKLRLDVVRRSLMRVDEAVFAKAIKGDVSAAKLIYSRWDNKEMELGEADMEALDMEEINAELAKLKEEIDALEPRTGSGAAEKAREETS